MRFCSIASGSSGNCIYVGSETTNLLIDTGISGKRIEAGLNELGISARELDGIFITHEHIDHISGLGVIARKYHIPIYATKNTIKAIKKTQQIGKIEDELFFPIAANEKQMIKDLGVYPIEISHDAAEPVGYRISYGNKRVAVCTDIGVYNDYIVECLKGLDAILLEANHDVNMLQVGPYPYYLKQRILSDRGHLSNENAGRLLNRILHDNLKSIMLGHLSKENNLPELAYETVRLEITIGDCPYVGNDFPIMVAKREEPSPVIQL